MNREQMTNVLIDAARAGGWAIAITPIVDAMPMRKLERLAESLTTPDVNEMSLEAMEAMLDTDGGATRSEVSAKVLGAADERVTRAVLDDLSLSALRALHDRQIAAKAHVAAAVRYAVHYNGRAAAAAEQAAAAAVAAGATDFKSIYTRIMAA